MDIGDDRGSKEEIEDFLQEVTPEIKVIARHCLSDPNEVGPSTKIEQCLIVAVGNKRVEVVVLTADWLRGPERRFSFVDANGNRGQSTLAQSAAVTEC